VVRKTPNFGDSSSARHFPILADGYIVRIRLEQGKTMSRAHSRIRRAVACVLWVALCAVTSLAPAQSCGSPNADTDYILGQNQFATSATTDMAMNWQSGLVWNRCLQGGFGGSCGFSAVTKSWNDWANMFLPKSFASENLWGVTANQNLIVSGAWRMAYWSELQGISSGCGGRPAYNGAVFTSAGALAVWSGSPYGTTDKAWYLDFNSGLQANIDRNSVMPVRLVRGGVPFATLPSNNYSQLAAPGQVVTFGPFNINGNGGQAWGGARISGGTLQVDHQGSYTQAIVSSTDTITVLVTAPALGDTTTATLVLHSALTFGTDPAPAGSEYTQVQEIVVPFTVQSPGFSVGGTVSGLTGSGLVLRNNGGDDLTVSGSTFMFPGRVALGGSYAVTVKTQPTGQTCTVSNGSGSNVSADVGNVAVSCAISTYSISGNVSGLSGAGLVLQNGSESLPIVGNGIFTFANKVSYGSSYAVSVKTQPVGQTCSVGSGSGSNVSANVSGVTVSCMTNTYGIGGTVSGLSGTGLVLQNGSEVLPISGNGAFVFATKVMYGGSYSVSIKSQPNTAQVCSVSHGNGSATAEVSSVQVACINLYVIHGSVSGLFSGSTVILQNGSDVLPISGGSFVTFAFTTKVPAGGSYNVIVKTQPSGQQTCTVANGSGSNLATDANVAVTCVAPNVIIFPAQASQTYAPGGIFAINPIATASSGLAVNYGSLTASVCTVSGKSVTSLSAGICTLAANQAASFGWEAAAQVTQNVVIQPGANDIAFAPLADRAWGGAPFALSATAGSGLAVEFASRTPATCSVTGNNVALLAVGICTIEASQTGDANYRAAVNVSRSFNVTRATQTLAFPTQADRTYAPGGRFVIDPPATASSGLTVTYSSMTAQTCTVSGTTVAIVGAGICTLAAAQPGDANYMAASPVTQTVTIAQAASALTLTANKSASVFGEPMTFTATLATGNPTPGGYVDFSADGVPLCAHVALSAGGASCAAATFTVGGHAMAASYTGDANTQASRATLGVQVAKASTALTITANPSPLTWTQTVAVGIAVAAVAPGAGTPSGSVAIDDGVETCTVVLPATTCALTPSQHGSLTLTARYSGDDNFSAIAQTARLDVDTAHMTATLVCTPSYATWGMTVSCRATCTNAGPAPALNAQCGMTAGSSFATTAMQEGTLTHAIDGRPSVQADASAASCTPSVPVASLTAGTSIVCTLSFVNAGSTVTATASASNALANADSMVTMMFSNDAPAVPAPALQPLALWLLMLCVAGLAGTRWPERRREAG